jgi:m7GpppX diphosphatase
MSMKPNKCSSQPQQKQVLPVQPAVANQGVAGASECVRYQVKHQYTHHNKHGQIVLVTESGEQHVGANVQAYISAQLTDARRVWVDRIFDGSSEQAEIKNDESTQPLYLVLPDTCNTLRCIRMHRSDSWVYAPENRFSWLVLWKDPSLRSIRDLRAEHIPLLKKMYADVMQCIRRVHGLPFRDEDVVAYAHYPPSVYHLHFHFTQPFVRPTNYDLLRTHKLTDIVNNLQVCPEYYTRSEFTFPVHTSSALYKALGGEQARGSASLFGGVE